MRATSRAMQVPVHVLGNVTKAPGLGWGWTCNFKGCLAHGIRIEHEQGYDAIAEHWSHQHRAVGVR